jgi:hypothetical protein
MGWRATSSMLNCFTTTRERAAVMDMMGSDGGRAAVMRLAAAMDEIEKASLDFRDWLERTNFSRPIARGVAEMCVDQVEFLAYKLRRNRDLPWWTGFSQRELRGTLACLRELERILGASSDQQRTPDEARFKLPA